MPNDREHGPRLSTGKARQSMDQLKALLAPVQEQAASVGVSAEPVSAKVREEVMARIGDYQSRLRGNNLATAPALPPEDQEVCDLWAAGGISFKEMRRRLLDLSRTRRDGGGPD